MSLPEPNSGESNNVSPRPFDFSRDSFAFANELIWEYRFDPASGRTTFGPRVPKPDYAHRCFVLTRAARQFLFHAQFDAAQPQTSETEYQRLVRMIVSRSPRRPSPASQPVLIPGYRDLRQFSAAHEQLLKAACGGAWRSYVLRSHWRMVFPISRAHQERTARRLAEGLRRRESPIVHLVRFPRLTINHGMILFEVEESNSRLCFRAYDPNEPEKPAQLFFDQESRSFYLPSNRYWAGGNLDVIEIYRSWFL